VFWLRLELGTSDTSCDVTADTRDRCYDKDGHDELQHWRTHEMPFLFKGRRLECADQRTSDRNNRSL